MIESGTDFEHGVLMFIEISHLIELNKQSGHLAGDTLLKGVSQLIKDRISTFPANEILLSRLSGATFAVAISGIPEKQAEEFANSLASDLSGLHEKGLTPFTDVGHIVWHSTPARICLNSSRKPTWLCVLRKSRDLTPSIITATILQVISTA